MKRILFFSIVFFTSWMLRAASPVAVGITYTHISGSVYKITYILVRDCRGIPFNSTNVGIFYMRGDSGTRAIQTVRTSIREITFNSKSACSPPNTPAGEGSEEDIYECVLDIDTVAGGKFKNNCKIWFVHELCCRNSAINNILPGNIYNDCMLDRCLAPGNSGPVLTNVRNIYARLNQPNYYNVMAFDTTDHDLLVYTLSNPLNGYNSPETYAGGYSVNYPLTPFCTQSGVKNCSPTPLSLPPKGLYADSLTGSLIYTPTNSAEISCIRFKIKEYRIIGGVKCLIGYSVCEYNLQVKNWAFNQPNLSKSSMKLQRHVKAGSALAIDFATELNDTLKCDSVRIWVSNSIPGSAVRISDKWRSDGSFTWTPVCSDIRSEPYVFVVHFYNIGDSFTRDFQSIAYTVFVDPDLDLGNDTVICRNNTMLLKSNISGSIRWNGNAADTVRTYMADTAGIYRVEVTRNGCTLKDSIILTELSKKPYINLGKDTIICNQSPGSPITLSTPFEKNVIYHWNVSPDPAYSVLGYTGSGMVVLSGENVCGFNSDTIWISRLNTPKVLLPADTQLCAPFQYVILPAENRSDYKWIWSDLSTDSFLEVTAEGVYTATASNACGTDKDSILILVSTVPVIDLGRDTIVCNGLYPKLDAAFPESLYVWSTGEKTSEISPSDSGIYTVNVQNFCAEVSDTIHLGSYYTPIAQLGRDTTVCAPLNLTLKADFPNSHAVWNTGDTGSEIAIKRGGTYIVTLSNSCGQSSDSLDVLEKSIPLFSLGRDSSFKKPFNWILKGPSNADHYRWNNSASDTLAEFSITDFGTYWLMAENVCGTVSDTIQISESSMVSELPDAAFAIYPNPSQGLLYIHSEHVIRGLKLFDCLGRAVVFSKESNGYNACSIDFRMNPDGLYTLLIATESGSYPIRVILQGVSSD